MILHPSLASADPLRYAEALTALHDAPLGSLHLDIEDTSFINNITFGMKTILMRRAINAAHQRDK